MSLEDTDGMLFPSVDRYPYDNWMFSWFSSLSLALPLLSDIVVLLNPFDIVRYDTKTKLTVCAPTREEKKSWIEELDKIIDQFLEAQQEQHKNSQSQYPKYVQMISALSS